MSERDPFQIHVEDAAETPIEDEVSAYAEVPTSGHETGEEQSPPPPPPADDGNSWYIIHTYSGFEKKVEESLRTRVEAFGFADKLGQILVPMEEVVELRNGKKVNSKRLLYPGYVLVQMAMSDEMRHYIKDTPRVTGFVGGGTDPVPLTAD